MFAKIDRVQVEQSITSRASELRNQPKQQTMTLGKPSKEIFLPVLPTIGSQNDCIQDKYPSSFSPSPDGVGFMEADLTSSGKRVRFSQPLEFWKEFDRDSGQLLDENGNLEEPVKKTDENTKEKERKSYEEKVSKKLSERREKRRGKARVSRTITEAVESLKLEDEKTSVRKFIAHYKRSTARDFRLQNKPTQRGIVCEQEENQPANDVISDSHQHNNSTRCKLCKFSRKTLALDRKENRKSECCTKTLTLKQKTRASSLPSLDFNGRKLFEERLLPDDYDDKCTLKKHVKYGCHGAGFRGGTSVSYLTPTPLIVQLFE